VSYAYNNAFILKYIQSTLLAVQQPLSVIIVGVGHSEEFSTEKQLDRVRVWFPNDPFGRDIVQFIEYEKVRPHSLAAAGLAQVSLSIKPNRRG